jgi:argininosuccinate lyase
MPFAPQYVTHVLNDNFEDAKALFLSPLLAIHHAHLVMLAERRILTREDGSALRRALAAITPEEIRAAALEPGCEDLFFHVERLIVARCGDAVAGRLHTARSRNDIDVTMYRMRLREFLLGLANRVAELRRTFIRIAERHRTTLVPLHTHTQPAQPSTVAHYALAVVEQLERDQTRLQAAFMTTNRCPLGACAVTGTGFPIDRARTSELLGFLAPTGNTYGSIAAIDYLLESVSTVAVLAAGLGRVIQDLLQWCTVEFGYLRLSEGFVQRSSIMPQKRNPVALEHARSIGSKALGQATGILVSVHNTPFGDTVDTEDDLQPLVFAAFRDAGRAVSVVASAMQEAEFDVQRLEERAGQAGITLTELADTLVRRHDVPFRTAHAIAARFFSLRQDVPGQPLSVTLAQASREIAGQGIIIVDEEVQRILSPRYFVEVRQTPGGPASSEIGRALARAHEALDRDAAWLAGTTEALKSAERLLAEASATL